MNDNHHELGLLFEAMVDRSATADERARLAELVSSDPQIRDEYLTYCQTHAMLAWEHGTLDGTAFPEPATDAAIPVDTAPDLAASLRRWRWLALAACALLVLTSGWLLLPKTGDRALASGEMNEASDPAELSDEERLAEATPSWADRPEVATITTSRGAVLSMPELRREIRLGETLRTGGYNLESGFLKLTLVNGIEVVVESPADFQLESAMKMVVRRGRMSAWVSPEGEGFVVETPSARLVDHGTEFSVDVAADSSSEVHVFDGEVTVRPRDAAEDSEDLRLMANQATLIHAGACIPEGIDIDHGRFVRTLTETIDYDGTYRQFVRSLQPVSWYRMSFAADGRTLADDGRVPRDATLHAGRMQPAPFKPGHVGTSLYLGGPATGAYAMADYVPATDGAITVSAWVQAKSRPRWAAIVKHWGVKFHKGRRTYEGPGGQFHFGLHEDSGALELQVRDLAGEVIALREQVPIELQRWQHVAFVVDGRQVRLYRNGRMVDAATCHGLATDGPPAMGIGIKLNHEGTGPDPMNPGYWHGRIDEVLRFDRALTDGELLELFEASRKERLNIADLSPGESSSWQASADSQISGG